MDNENKQLIFKNFKPKDTACIYDIHSREKARFTVENNIDVSFLKSGLYIVKVDTETEVFTKKIICH